MSLKPVDCVWFWRMNNPSGSEKPSSIEKAVYGRFPGKTYSKDYLQFSPSSSEVESMFRLTDNRIDVEYKWIGGRGGTTGSIEKSSDRFHLKWKTGDIPECFRFSPHPTIEGPRLMQGDPDAASDGDADSRIIEFNRSCSGTNTCFFLVAVKLVDEPSMLHLRVYAINPPRELDEISIDHLPARLRDAATMLSTASRNSSTCVRFASSDSRQGVLADALSALDSNPNLLLVGPPGTGKTVLLDRLRSYVEDGSVSFDEELQCSWTTECPAGGRSKYLVLHPDYSYENFVVGLMPKAVEQGVTVEAVAGPLVQLAEYAKDTPDTHSLLILDEINRTNAAAVFGDALAILDKDSRGSVSVELPYEDIGIRVHDRRLEDNRLTLPGNLWIVGAMNSSDRSAVPLDSALRRRFTVLHMPPDYSILASRLSASEHVDWSSLSTESPASDMAWLAVSMLKGINRRIRFISGEDFELGHSFLWNLCGDTGADFIRSLADAWDSRLMPALRMNYRDNDRDLADVLGGRDAEGVLYRFADPPAGLSDRGRERIILLPLSNRDDGSVIDAFKLLAADRP